MDENRIIAETFSFLEETRFGQVQNRRKSWVQNATAHRHASCVLSRKKREVRRNHVIPLAPRSGGKCRWCVLSVRARSPKMFAKRKHEFSRPKNKRFLFDPFAFFSYGKKNAQLHSTKPPRLSRNARGRHRPRRLRSEPLVEPLSQTRRMNPCNPDGFRRERERTKRRGRTSRTGRSISRSECYSNF